MRLSDTDKELLELLAIAVPWEMVCAEFQHHYAGPGALARRLFQMAQADLVEIRVEETPDSRVLPEMLEAHALRHACYENPEAAGDSPWRLIATDRGFSLIESRLAPQ